MGLILCLLKTKLDIADCGISLLPTHVHPTREVAMWWQPSSMAASLLQTVCLLVWLGPCPPIHAKEMPLSLLDI